MRRRAADRPPAGTLLDRTLAYLFDGLLTAGVWGLVVLALTGGDIGRIADDPARRVLAGFLFLLIPFTYFVVVEWTAGTTAGKRLVGLTVRRVDGSRAGLFEVTVRNVLRLAWALGPLGPLLLALDAVFIQLTEADQRVGDLAAGTRVLREHDGPLAL